MQFAPPTFSTFRTDVLLAVLLQNARAGSAEALGQVLETCRSYLLRIAAAELRPSLRAKVDAADVVQETFIEAMRDFPSFRGETETQLLCWLRGILRHNLTDLMRRFDAHCRCLHQEACSLDCLGSTCSLLAVGIPICEQLIARERRRALEAALQRLPPMYRQVLLMRCGERLSFAEIGNHLQRSPEAARKMWCRAVAHLRREMHAYDEA